MSFPPYASAIRVLSVDDDPSQRRLQRAILQAPKYQVAEAASGAQALAALDAGRFDVVLLDKRMPGMDGSEVLHCLRDAKDERLLPVIMVTGHAAHSEAMAACLAAGATDFIRKPYDPIELIARVDAAAAHKRLTDQLEDVESLLFAQARMAEAKDRHTGDHVARVAHNAIVFGRTLGLGTEELRNLRRGAVLHDIGKLGVPDAILLKPGPLTAEEFEIMKRHTVIGARLVDDMKRLRPAAAIIRHHHERWNGSGYPDGLAGEAIPFVARVFQLVDIYDALAFDRPYKSSLEAAEIIAILEEEAALGWRDPTLTAAFVDLLRRRPQDLAPPDGHGEDLGQAIFADILKTGALHCPRAGATAA